MISKSYADGMILFAWVKAERKYYWNGTMSESRHNLFFKSIDSDLGKYYLAKCFFFTINGYYTIQIIINLLPPGFDRLQSIGFVWNDISENYLDENNSINSLNIERNTVLQYSYSTNLQR